MYLISKEYILYSYVNMHVYSCRNMPSFHLANAEKEWFLKMVQKMCTYLYINRLEMHAHQANVTQQVKASKASS